MSNNNLSPTNIYGAIVFLSASFFSMMFTAKKEIDETSPETTSSDQTSSFTDLLRDMFDRICLWVTFGMAIWTVFSVVYRLVQAKITYRFSKSNSVSPAISIHQLSHFQPSSTGPSAPPLPNYFQSSAPQMHSFSTSTPPAQRQTLRAPPLPHKVR